MELTSDTALIEAEQLVAVRDLLPDASLKITLSETGEFSHSEDWKERSGLEAELLDQIDQSRNGLVVNRATATYSYVDPQTLRRGSFRANLYRLSAEQNHAYLDAHFWPFRCGFKCQVMMVVVEPQWQGSFFNFKDFLIGKICATLFALQRNPVYHVFGHALGNKYPVRNPADDWRMQKLEDGEYRLVRMYQRLGFFRAFAEDNALCLYSPNSLRLMEAEDPNKANFVKASLEVHQWKPFHGANRADKKQE
ncbi:MAG TPA: hypothetical protein PLC99_15005 [Verrucomicrobiota bacterium]|nr:hypothetical protein [Verrucomicrobiota bacterium]